MDIWVVFLTLLSLLCLLMIVYRMGYKRGANMVLNIWKKTLDDTEE